MIIESIFSDNDSKRRVIARIGEEVRTQEDLHRDVTSLVGALQSSPGEEWCLYCEDAYYFTVGLIALSVHTTRVVLLPRLQKDIFFLLGISTEKKIGIVTDLSLSSCSQLKECSDIISLPSLHTTTTPDVPFPFAANKFRIDIYTSGSSGTRKRLSRTFESLWQEVAMLESMWGEALEGLRIISTVSHHHIYGLIFKVLWPLFTRKEFQSQTFFFPESIATSSGPYCLVSSPAHLARIPEYLALARMQGRCKFVFSSGGPLRSETALLWHNALHASPVEVFGSTESGAVAWRRQIEEASDEWNILPRVSIAQGHDNALLIQSPFVAEGAELYSEGDSFWVKSADKITLTTFKSFRHLGREDRVIKLEEQRISLREIEKLLDSFPGVKESRVTPVLRGQRQVLGAVVVKTASSSADHLQKQLQSYLFTILPSLSVPKVWRLVDALPCDTQGKCTEELLAQLFSSSKESMCLESNYFKEQGVTMTTERGGADEGATTPVTIGREVKGTEISTAATVRWHIPKALTWVEGHFPSFPAVPGVVQIKWILNEVSLLLGRNLSVHRMEAVKFHNLLAPVQDCVLEIEVSYEGDEDVERKECYRIAWRLGEGDRKFSSGRLFCTPLQQEICK